MKRFLFTVLIYSIATLAVLTVVELSLRHIPNDYKVKNAYLTQHGSRVKVLVLGDSHLLYSIRPDLLPMPAFNAAHPAKTLRYDRYIFDKFVGGMDSLRYVVIPIDYYSLVSDLEDQAPWRIKDYCLYYGYPAHLFNPLYRTELFGGQKFSGDIKALAHYLLRNETLCECDSLGFGRSHSLSNRPSDWSDGAARVVLHTHHPDDTLVASNRQSILHIVGECQRRGIEPIIMTTPVIPSYIEAVDSAQHKQVFSFLDSLSAAGVAWINLERSPLFQDDDFYDPDHVNEIGAEKVTHILAAHLLNADRQSD